MCHLWSSDSSAGRCAIHGRPPPCPQKERTSATIISSARDAAMSAHHWPLFTSSVLTCYIQQRSIDTSGTFVPTIGCGHIWPHSWMCTGMCCIVDCKVNLMLNPPHSWFVWNSRCIPSLKTHPHSPFNSATIYTQGGLFVSPSPTGTKGWFSTGGGTICISSSVLVTLLNKRSCSNILYICSLSMPWRLDF
jgi:hypothetical protein